MTTQRINFNEQVMEVGEAAQHMHEAGWSQDRIFNRIGFELGFLPQASESEIYASDFPCIIGRYIASTKEVVYA